MWLPVRATGWERHVFPAHDNRCQKRRKSHDRLGFGPEPITGRLVQIVPNTLVESYRLICACRCVFEIYRGTSVYVCGVSFISVVEPQCLIYVLRKLQRFLLTDFILYTRTCIYMPGVFDATEKDTTRRGCVIVLLYF
jgi:hypothetical protein